MLRWWRSAEKSIFNNKIATQEAAQANIEKITRLKEKINTLVKNKVQASSRFTGDERYGLPCARIPGTIGGAGLMGAGGAAATYAVKYAKEVWDTKIFRDDTLTSLMKQCDSWAFYCPDDAPKYTCCEKTAFTTGCSYGGSCQPIHDTFTRCNQALWAVYDQACQYVHNNDDWCYIAAAVAIIGGICLVGAGVSLYRVSAQKDERTKAANQALAAIKRVRDPILEEKFDTILPDIQGDPELAPGLAEMDLSAFDNLSIKQALNKLNSTSRDLSNVGKPSSWGVFGSCLGARNKPADSAQTALLQDERSHAFAPV